MKRPSKWAACLAALSIAAAPLVANAGLIRDAEIESTLRDYTNPIFEAADIPPEDVRILIVSDPAINAYVAGGLNIFINTGLLLATQKPGEVIGVLAHETGHISGAHLSQISEKSTRAMLGGAIGALLGAAAIAGGAGQAGAGVIMGSQSMAQRSFYTDIRMNEQSADQAALKFLDANDISATGMLEMFETLRRKDSGVAIKPDPYLRTHPLTTERIATLRNHVQGSAIPADQVPESFKEKHARMVAKLVAFTQPYAATLTKYPESDMSVAARYARAIAEYKRSKLDAALTGIDALIKQYPNDPFFYDTKGQILFENGKLAEASTAYAKASALMPKSALIATDYAKTLIAQNDNGKLPQAIALLERAKEEDDSYSATWRQLGIAYGKQGRLGMSYLALAEEAALAGDYKMVLQHVARARTYKDDESLDLLLDDLARDAKAQLEKKKEDNLF